MYCRHIYLSVKRIYNEKKILQIKLTIFAAQSRLGMMHNMKILNDPVYGFVGIPYNQVFSLVEHPFFQRLRRIKQLSLTYYVYPGALHTRFNHAIGALHLMIQAIEVLKSKGVDISEEESTAVCIAILLHDIGHGPFSHTLENTLLDIHHEELSLHFMEALNEEFEGSLDLAIEIFKGVYPRKFLHQLISSQLDMDRLDYLNRDSFFTGVSEGVIGYDRIIKMLNVVGGELVVEEKGLYSIEKFLIARRIMYWQVYLHKTVMAAEVMLIKIFERAKSLCENGWEPAVSEPLLQILRKPLNKDSFKEDRLSNLKVFASVDDYDIVMALKIFMESDDRVLSFLSTSLLNRNIFRLKFSDEPIDSKEYQTWVKKAQDELGFNDEEVSYLVNTGVEANSTYNRSKNEIQILFKNGDVKPMSECFHFNFLPGKVEKHYIVYPKFLEANPL